MRSVGYDEIVQWLSETGRITIPTLGRRITLDFWIADGIINGCDTHGNHHRYSREFWNEVCNIIDILPEPRREITTEYAHLRNFRNSQGVPALCRAYCEAHR